MTFNLLAAEDNALVAQEIFENFKFLCGKINVHIAADDRV